MRLDMKIKSIFKRLYIKHKFGNRCRFNKSVEIGKDCRFEGKNYLGGNTYFINSKLGYASGMGSNFF